MMNMGRIIAITDPHGCFLEFQELLQKVSFSPQEDTLIILGDLVDRGPHAMQIVEFLMNLKKDFPNNVFIVKGNHDEMFLDWLYDTSGDINQENFYLNQGGSQTVRSYCEDYGLARQGDAARTIIKDYYPEHIRFLHDLADYVEVDQYLFVHAGVNLALNDWKNSSGNDFRWHRQPFIREKNNTGKTIIFGHTQTYLLNSTKDNYDVWHSSCGTKIGIDGGCVYKGMLHALVIEDNEMSVTSVKKQ